MYRPTTQLSVVMLCLCMYVTVFSQPSSFEAFYKGNNQLTVLASQAQVNAFRKHEVKGDLLIRGKDITDLSPLSKLKRIGGTLAIVDNPKLTSLQGFSNLAFIGGDFVVKNNLTLIDCEGFSFLAFSGFVLIQDNPQLSALSFPFPAKISGLVISNNDILTDISSLSSLEEISPGRNCFDSFAGSLIISGNDALQNIDALSQLTSIKGNFAASLVIKGNKNLQDIDGLEALASLRGAVSSIEISDNFSLASVRGLANLSQLGHNNKLKVCNNPALFDCCALYHLIKKCHHWVWIANNGGGCTKEEILAAGPCPSCEPLVLSSQAQVDAFAQNPSTSVSSLTISGPDITNVDALSSITEIKSTLRVVNNPLLTNLNGLSSLVSVGGTVCEPLVQGIFIEGNALLEKVDLPQLTALQGSLLVNNNAGLKYVTLTGLTSISTGPGNGKIGFSGNASLRVINLSNLATLSGESVLLELTNNPAFLALNVLSLTQFQGTVRADILITGNASLRGLATFRNLSQLNAPITSLTVTNNIKMMWCCGLHDLVANAGGGAVTIDCYASDVCGTCTDIVNGNLTLPVQDEVDQFSAIFGCTDIDILTVSGPDITNVDGLSTINDIHWGLDLVNNPVLSDLSGFNGMHAFSPRGLVGQHIKIANNPSLTTIDAFINIVNPILLGIDVQDNPALQSITGFNQITKLGGGLRLRNNPVLSNIDGFSSINRINEFVILGIDGLTIDNTGLTNINALSALTNMGGGTNFVAHLDISNNQHLENIDGLSNMNFDQVGLQVFINVTNNAVLTTIDGFSGVTGQSGGFGPWQVAIVNNPLLELCCSALNLGNASYPTDYTISGNAPTCTLPVITDPTGPCSAAMMSAISVYPNPNNGTFSVELSEGGEGDYRMVVRDFTGTVKAQSEFKKGKEALVSDGKIGRLKKGIYTVQFYKGNELLSTRKMIVN